MDSEFTDQYCADMVYKMRYLESIMAQTKKDYAELNQLWQNVENDNIVEMEVNELLKKISWVKEGLKKFLKYRDEDIEGVLWVDTNQIIIDLQTKENRIIKILSSLSNQTENSQPR